MNIPYRVIRSRRRRRTVTIQIEDGRPVIRAPWFLTAEEIHRLYERKRAWLEKKIPFLSSPPPFPDREPLMVAYLGVPYLVGPADGPDIRLHGDRLLVPEGSGPSAVETWFIQKAREYLPPRVHLYASSSGFIPRSIRIGRARCCWGSCSGDNRLTFSWRLMTVPPTVIDYVICHELAHIRVKNHSARFWSVVEGLYPSYRAQRLWLKDNSRLIFLR